MKTAKEFRRAHFKALIEKYGRKEVQARMDCTATYVSQLAGNAVQTRNIGDAKAREIEKLFDLPAGSLDAPLHKAPIPKDQPEGEHMTPVELQLLQMFRSLTPEAKGRVAGELTATYYAQHIGELRNPLEGTGAVQIREADKRESREKRTATTNTITGTGPGKAVK